MKDPSLPLQKAVHDALVAGLGSTEVYDEVPLDAVGKIKAAFPFVHIGEDQIVSNADQCHDACEAFATVQVYSRAVGMVEVKTIMAQVCLLLDVKLTLVGFEVITHSVDFGPQYLKQPDGLTKKGVATFAYKMGPTA